MFLSPFVSTNLTETSPMLYHLFPYQLLLPFSPFSPYLPISLPQSDSCTKMPMGSKSRSNKRSSGTSYASTVTTVVFVTVCVFGAWMLTSNSVVPPQTTTRASFDSSTSRSSSDPHLPRKIPTDNTPAFEDNPGDLPNDAIKPDDDSANNQDQDSTTNPDQSEDNSSGALGNDTENTNTDNDNNNNNIVNNSEMENSNDGGGDEDGGKQEPIEHESAKEEQENVKEEQVVEASSVVDENPQDLKGKMSEEEGEKQKEHQIQVSEESAMTHNQQAEEISTENEKHKEAAETTQSSEASTTMQTDIEQSPEKVTTTDTQSQEAMAENTANEHQRRNHLEGNPDIGKQETNQESTTTSTVQEMGTDGRGSNPQNTLSDEEQEKRMEIQQRKEEQSQQGETSDDQVQHDEEAPIESHSIAEETKAQIEKEESQHMSVQTNPEKMGGDAEKQSAMTSNTTPPGADSSFTVGESSSGIPKESRESKKSWSTQADQSENQKERGGQGQGGGNGVSTTDGSIYGYSWDLCNVTAGTDYIPCLDNEKAIRNLHSRNHYEHRERHCPEEGPTCLVPLPEGYKTPIPWPQSRDKIWFHNVPHKTLAEVKGHQNWVKVTGEFLTFPGGGTQFIHGALHYIDFVKEAVPEIAWGKRTRVILDVGCGVASFGGYLFDRDVLAMSFAPKDEHEAQTQFALERGIPAISAVMGTQRLPFPSRVFDLIHCARCRVPWHIEGGTLLLELNRVLRPGGYFVWSATPVYQKLEEDVQIWKEMSELTVSMCWELVTIKKDRLNSVGIAVYRKPETNECYEERKKKQPPMCKPDDDPNAAWYVPLQACMHNVPASESERGSKWPEEWPHRLETPPYWLNKTQMGIYGKPAPEDFTSDYEHWKWVVSKSYMSGLGISWSNVRNVMDMRAVYGGFAAAMKDHKLWVLNVVNIDSPDTLPIIFERGLFGIYHDWCESFSTYPRTYDLLHADHLFSKLKKRCKIAPVMAEVDRITRPGGKLIVRDESNTVGEIENLLKSLHWEVHLTFSKNKEGILSAQKTTWRPDTYAAAS